MCRGQSSDWQSARPSFRERPNADHRRSDDPPRASHLCAKLTAPRSAGIYATIFAVKTAAIPTDAEHRRAALLSSHLCASSWYPVALAFMPAPLLVGPCLSVEANRDQLPMFHRPAPEARHKLSPARKRWGSIAKRKERQRRGTTSPKPAPPQKQSGDRAAVPGRHFYMNPENAIYPFCALTRTHRNCPPSIG